MDDIGDIYVTAKLPNANQSEFVIFFFASPGLAVWLLFVETSGGLHKQKPNCQTGLRTDSGTGPTQNYSIQMLHTYKFFCSTYGLLYRDRT